jgi:hypothetical protein
LRDLIDAKLQLAVRQDQRQPGKILDPKYAVPVGISPRGIQSPDFVIVEQRSYRDARQLGDILDNLCCDGSKLRAHVV